MNQKYFIGDVIKTRHGDIQLIDFFYSEKQRYAKYKCLQCGTEDVKCISSLKRTGCRVCCNQKVVRGINDLWTTAPQIAKLLLNKNDGYNVTKFSTKKVDWLCPICNSVLHKRVSYVSYAENVSCPYCSDGISFPNKLMSNVLSQINVSYIREWSPAWAGKFRYDFYIPQESLIVEMDGGYGHGNKGTDDIKKSQIAIDQAKDNLAKEHELRIIRIDCNYPNNNRDGYIIKNIKSSEFSKIFNLSNVDFTIAAKESTTTLVIKACDLYNNGSCISRIGRLLNVNPVTISRWLKIGANLKLCDYSPRNRKNTLDGKYNKKPIHAVDIHGLEIAYDSIINAANSLKIDKSSIYRCLNGKQKSCKGYTFKYI